MALKFTGMKEQYKAVTYQSQLSKIYLSIYDEFMDLHLRGFDRSTYSLNRIYTGAVRRGVDFNTIESPQECLNEICKAILRNNITNAGLLGGRVIYRNVA